MKDFDFKNLYIFSSVAKLKSFAKTANALGLSKSVISTRVSELEKSLGVTLLARTTREVNLTSDGAIFLKYCNSILEKIQNLDNFLQEYKEISGTLKIAIPPYFSRHYIVPYLNEFLNLYPKLKLNITLTEDPVDIISNVFDLQIRIQIPEEEDLKVVKITDNKKVICASPKYLKKHGYPTNLQDLHSHNCIIFGENSNWTLKNNHDGKITKLKDLSGNIKCNNGEAVKELVLSGNGITLKSIIDIQEEIKNQQIEILFKDCEVVNKTQFYAVYPKSKYTSPRTKAFIDFFQKKLAP